MSEQSTHEGYDLYCLPLCKGCEKQGQPMYVYLRSGTRVKIGNPKSIHVTESDVIIDCGEDQAMEFRRSDVYFTCCGDSLPPGPS